jgi:hypothetical protein
MWILRVSQLAVGENGRDWFDYLAKSLTSRIRKPLNPALVLGLRVLATQPVLSPRNPDGKEMVKNLGRQQGKW